MRHFSPRIIKLVVNGVFNAGGWIWTVCCDSFKAFCGCVSLESVQKLCLHVMHMVVITPTRKRSAKMWSSFAYHPLRVILTVDVNGCWPLDGRANLIRVPAYVLRIFCQVRFLPFCFKNLGIYCLLYVDKRKHAGKMLHFLWRSLFKRKCLPTLPNLLQYHCNYKTKQIYPMNHMYWKT